MKYNGTRFFSAFALFSILLSIINCRHSTDESDFPQMCFDRDILPIFLNNCALSGCHDGTGESDLILNSFASISDDIKPGDPEDSEIYEAITGAGEDMMPPDRPLSAANRTRIRIWILQGATSSSCPE